MNSIKAINDLSRLSPSILDQIKSKTNTIIESGWYILGAEVTEFEKNFAQYCGAGHCVSVANGTEALELALKALGLEKGKRIATVANGGMYSTLAILAVGSIPVYIDIDEVTLTMSKAKFKEASDNGQIDGVILTHLYGQLGDTSICDLAKEKNLPCLEDCAQAHGATKNGKKAGSFGDAGCFSFYPTKNLGAMGDGGAIVTSSLKILEELKKLRQYGWDKKYYVVKEGCRNSRLDEMQAGILNIKLGYLDQWNKQRREIVKEVVEKCSGLSTLRFPAILDDSYVGHLFIVRTSKRDQLKDFLKTKNIPCDIHYPLPDYRQKIFENSAVAKTSNPNTEKACEEILTIPCFPELRADEVGYLSQALIEFEKCTL